MPYNILISTKISIAVSLPINGIQAPAANKGIRLTRMPHKTSALMAENYLMQAARGGGVINFWWVWIPYPRPPPLEKIR
ncbi:MAG: hypothetical protein CTY16_15525 [Methylobacter sp.]|nr:MAG: hypothetical protein CTY16_15525 [Methylobacter sp.]